MHGYDTYDYGARGLQAAIMRFNTIDPMAEKRYSISPYAYCSNNPITRIDPTGMLDDDYYSSVSGKYLGTDYAPYGSDNIRLISDDKYKELTANQVPSPGKMQKEGTLITVDDAKIQSDLQVVADNSTSSGLEHQACIVLDRENALITSVMGTPGTNNRSDIEYSYSSSNPASLIVGTDGKMKVLIGQAHGHPAATGIGIMTAKTMSSDVDKPTSQSLQIPIYGIDAMDNKSAGTPANIHRVTPNGSIINNIGRTSSGFNIGRQSLEIWGRSGVPVRK